MSQSTQIEVSSPGRLRRVLLLVAGYVAVMALIAGAYA